MLYTSVNTDYNNDIQNWTDIEHQIRCLAETGFTHTSWMHNWNGEYIYSSSEMFYVRDLLRHYGLKSHTIHATEGGFCKDYKSSNGYIREAGVDLLKNRIDLCTHIGADTMVLHMAIPFREFRKREKTEKEFYEQVYKSFDEVHPYAKAAGVKIAVENLLFAPAEYQRDQFERLFDRYDKDFVGLCFDSGHASIMFQDNYYELLEKYHDRLYATHLQDTDSLPREDLDDDKKVLSADKHRCPFTGVLDWNRIAYWVARAPIDLPADFEVCLQYGKKYTSPEQEMEDLKQAYCYAERFYQMVVDEKAKINYK